MTDESTVSAPANGRSSPPVRPAPLWFVFAVIVPLVASTAVFLLVRANISLMQFIETALSIIAAIAFLAGTWHSIGTRTLLVELETLDLESQEALAIKRNLVAELNSNLLRHLRIEWRCYLAGGACLVGMFALLLLRQFSASVPG